MKNSILEHIWSKWKIINWKNYKNCKIVSYEWETYIVSDKAILTIQTTSYCNAKCKFCFNGITFYPNTQKKWISKYLEDLIWFTQLAGIKTIWISWWEPTLDIDYLISLLKLIQWKFSDIILHTNWSNLFFKIDWKYLIDYLILNGVNKLTLSLADYRNENNKKIMNFFTSYQGVTEEQIQYLGKCSERCSIRLSCFLNKEWIWSVKDIMSYINYGQRNWINNFIFRAASNSDTPQQYIKLSEFYKFWIDNIKNIDDYVEEMVKQWFIEDFKLHKTDLHVHSLKRENLNVVFESVSEELDHDDKIRRIIYFPNDIAYKSWIDPTAVIFHSDKEKIISDTLEKTIAYKWMSPGLSTILSRNIIEREKKIHENNYQFPIDLHIHTINSDWKKTFDEVLIEAKQYGVKKICITEHNFISENYESLVNCAEKEWIWIDFPWVEVNVVTHMDWNPDRKHHLLCYWHGLLDKKFQEYIRKPLNIKNDFFYDQVKKLQRKWYEIPDFYDMLKWIDENWVYTTPYKQLMTKSCIAKYLSKITWEDIDTVKNKYLISISEEETYKDYIKAEDIIPIIKDLWWICWLAHPWWDRPFQWEKTNTDIDYKHLLSEIWRLKALWMDWIEVYHKSHSQETKKILEKVCNDWMLLVIWWSDYHWKVKENPEYFDIYPWSFWLTESEYKKIINLLHID